MDTTATLFIWLSLLGPATAMAAGQATAAERSLSQYGITWTFSQPASTGRFITGDWWVVGPVTVQSVSPASTADRHGSVVNPPAGDKQGYDGRLADFVPSLRPQFPLELKPGESLVSTASVDAIGDRTADTVPGQYCRGPLRTSAVLTCVDAPPPSDAFRPAYCIFEQIYFARPDSNVVGHNVYAYRKQLGRVLAREHPVLADMVVPVLDSGTAAALGFADETGVGPGDVFVIETPGGGGYGKPG